MHKSGWTFQRGPFCVPEKSLLGDGLHFTDYNKFSESTSSIPVGKFLNENIDDLPSLPDEYSTDTKVKKLRLISFPLVLPIVKGFEFLEGSIEKSEICDKFAEIHELYADWIYIHNRKHVASKEFFEGEPQIPIPNGACDVISHCAELHLKVLFKSTHNPSNPYPIIKAEIEKFVKQHKQEEEIQETSVPEEVNFAEDKTVVSTSTSSSTGVKNERLLAFLAILFSKPHYDRKGDLSSLVPAEIADEARELLTSSSSTSEQARTLSDGIEVLADDISRERSYLSRASKFPFLSNTLITYALQAHFHSGAIDGNMESLKKSFSVLALLAPPANSTDEYNGYINSSKNIEVDRMLDQPNEKRASIRKEVFIKGKQESIDDVIAFIANIIVYARFWVKMDAENTEDQPYIVQLITEIADYLSSSEFKSFYDRFKRSTVFMPHTLIAYIFNIFSTFIKMAKNPHVIRKFKVSNSIDSKEVKIGRIMQNSLLDQLQLCTATSSLQNLFANPTASFKIFCPNLTIKIQDNHSGNNDRGQKRPFEEKNQDSRPKRVLQTKTETRGSIVNTTGKKIIFPRGMDKRYCSDFLDSNRSCRHEKCNFVHVVYPSGFTEKDKHLMEAHIKETEGISVNPNMRAAGNNVSV